MALNRQHKDITKISSSDFEHVLHYIESISKEILVKELELYHVNNEHEKIIETIEKLPKNQLDLLLISMLARAYNNVQSYQKAFELLKPLEQQCKKQPIWNYRIAYSCYYLDRDDLALSYFNKYLDTLDTRELEKEKKEINEYIEVINKNKNYPYFSEPFKFRVARVWKNFIDNENALLARLKNMKTRQEGEEILRNIKQILYPLFIEPSFGLFFRNGKWELTLSSDLDDSIFPIYIYFKEKMPKELEKHWVFFIGRQASKKNHSIDFGEFKIRPSDVQLIVRKQKKDTFKIILYNEKLKFSTQDEYNASYEVAYILTEQVLGEVRYIKFIEETDISNKELSNCITLDMLPEYIKTSINLDISISETEQANIIKKVTNRYKNDTNAEHSPALLEITTNKNLSPSVMINFSTGMSEEEWEEHNNPALLFRNNVEYLLPEKYIAKAGKIHTCRTFGKTIIPRIVNAFIQSEADEIAQEYHSCGAFIGMFILKFNCSELQDDINYLSKINTQIHAKLNETHMVYGSAFGLGYAFIDFIAWDLEAVVSAFKQVVMKDTNITYAGLRSIRSHSEIIRYK